MGVKGPNKHDDGGRKLSLDHVAARLVKGINLCYKVNYDMRTKPKN